MDTIDYSPERKYLQPVACGNCGKPINPGQNVGVGYGKNKREIILFHVLEANCIPIGNFFDGYWNNDGTITFYDAVEKC